MRGHDEEQEQIKAEVSCAALLEQLQPGWTLDKRESTRRCLKYRRGPGHILIVNHEGRGWWDPLSTAKGDVFDLVRHLDPGLGFGQARDVLRAFVGLAPPDPVAPQRARRRATAAPGLAERWAARRPVAGGSPAWRYLTGERGLPGATVAHAVRLGLLREGPQASAWFAHHDGTGRLTGIEMRGPTWRSFSADGQKALFRLSDDAGQTLRLVVMEAAIDALSLAAAEGLRPGTLYAAVAGGMGPLTHACLEAELQVLPARSGALLVAATDADAAGERLAARLAELAAAAGVPCERLRPWGGHKDWNDCLRARAAEGG